jgi:cyclohexanone monooxygenase
MAVRSGYSEGIDFKGKRVGVIGTGSTGIQVITALAPQASHLTVFQRSPQYSVPVGNGPVSPDDVKSVNPITEVTPKGIKTADGVEHELDVLIFATGFDAVDGNYTRIDLRGRKGLTIQDKWKGGPTSYLGVANADYPNLFMILGPNGPFTNLPPSIETQVEWISDLIKHMNDTGRQLVEATHEGEDGWTATCKEIAGCTLFPKADSWIFGANIPGKPRTVMFYLAGLGAYTQKLNEVAGSGYSGFEIR